MANLRFISLHPKLAFGIDIIFSTAMVWWFFNFQSPWYLLLWFVIRFLWWVGLVKIVYYPPYLSRVKHLVSLFIFNIGIIPYLVFSDPLNQWEINLIKLFAIVLPAISFYLIPATQNSLSVMEKPHRRWKLFLTLVGVSGCWLAFDASLVFQIISGAGTTIFWFLFALMFITAVSFWEWLDYGIAISRQSAAMAAVMLLIMAELGAVLILWPIGYLVSCFFVAWVWYIIWLLFRFSLTKEGINWQRQRVYLVSNLALMAIYLLFVVRWK